jgi:hypothetical protein
VAQVSDIINDSGYRHSAEIAIVTGDLPSKENVFHFWPLADIVNDQVVITLRRFLGDDHSDVRHATT